MIVGVIIKEGKALRPSLSGVGAVRFATIATTVTDLVDAHPWKEMANKSL